MDYIEQILTEGCLDLRRNREMWKSIRRGEWTLGQIKDWFNNKEKDLEKVYLESKLQHSPDEDRIKALQAIGQPVPLELTILIRDPEKDPSPKDLESLELYPSIT